MYRRAVDYADPSSLDAMPMDCVSATSAASLPQTARAVGCTGRASQAYEQASANAALWVTPTFPLLDPLRIAFALGTGPLRRGMGLTALASLVGWVGHGIGLIAVVARSVGAATNVTRGAEAAVDTATLGVSDASPSEGGVAAVHTTTEDTQISGDDADDVVDFAHGRHAPRQPILWSTGSAMKRGSRTWRGL